MYATTDFKNKMSKLYNTHNLSNKSINSKITTCINMSCSVETKQSVCLMHIIHVTEIK